LHRETLPVTNGETTMTTKKLSAHEAWKHLIAAYDTRYFSRQNDASMELPKLLDRRTALQAIIEDAQGELRQVELETKFRLLDDCSGMEDCLTVNWNKLGKLYGGRR
jgi:predicted DNA-binding WGR domain protein